jgi:hypothetical protein
MDNKLSKMAKTNAKLSKINIFNQYKVFNYF